jgi:hypothetical protein
MAQLLKLGDEIMKDMMPDPKFTLDMKGVTSEQLENPGMTSES